MHEVPGQPRADVVIVDDHELLAHSLALALLAEGLIVERCVRPTADAVLDLVASARPHVVLLDLDLGFDVANGSSLPLVAPLRAAGAQVVMFTGITDRILLARCIEAGATGIVAKSEPFESLVASVRRAVAGEALASAWERTEMLAELRRHREAAVRQASPFESLTPREAAVLAGLMDGRTAEQISGDHFVALTTVRSQIRTMLLKLDVHSQLAAVARARRANWSPPQEEGPGRPDGGDRRRPGDPSTS